MNKVGFISLGCHKNRLDSEVMLGLLQEAGYTIVPEEEAEILVVNTCGFIQEAKEEAIQTTLEAAQYKGHGTCRFLIMAGCFSQRYVKDLVHELPEVDFFIGLDDVPHIVKICQNLERDASLSPPDPCLPGKGQEESPLEGGRGVFSPPEDDPSTMPLVLSEGERSGRTVLVEGEQRWVCSRISDTLAQKTLSSYLYDHTVPRLRLGARHTAYVKIAEGCCYQCSFCAIPMIRGKLRSRSMDSIVHEVKLLAEQGVKEVILIAQDTTLYGVDLTGKPMIVPLLERLVAVDKIRWVRLMYAYPTSLDLPLIRLVAGEEKICTYLDLPLQHIDDTILKRMRRGITEAKTRKLIDQLRTEIPGLTLRTSFIVGFPGENDEKFHKLENFVRDAQFDRVGVFMYSYEDGTLAYDMPDQIPHEIAEARHKRLMEVQANISLKKHQEMVGTIQTVLVDGVSEETPLLLEARTEGQAPEIDGVVYINEGITEQGAFEKVQITEAFPYDLVGKIV
jgi:ribosomal protein S12 methylthiotransferase